MQGPSADFFFPIKPYGSALWHIASIFLVDIIGLENEVPLVAYRYVFYLGSLDFPTLYHCSC